MYLNRIQLINNGPIQRLDVSLPFNGDKPRPIVLVGENGTGKSILLSHIVNALVAAQCVAFPEAPEVDEGKVYKLRSPSYIRAESECYHSPLLVLGLQNSLGKEGLALYRMPEGNQIDAEEFEEFGNAYNVFKGTATYDADVRLAIQSAQKPVVFVDGGTDILYLQRAAELLNFDDKLSKVELRDGGGDGNLKRVWKALDTSGQFGLVRHKVVILHDCDSDVEDGEKGTVFRRKISLLQEGPIKRGVENLFGKATIEKAKDFNLAFIDIDPGRVKLMRGKEVVTPEVWTINKDEKKRLCEWLCENGTASDFQGFSAVFEILDSIPELLATEAEVS